MNDILLFMPCLGKCGGGGAWAKAMWTKDLCKLNCLRVVQRTKNLMSLQLQFIEATATLLNVIYHMSLIEPGQATTRT